MLAVNRPRGDTRSWSNIYIVYEWMWSEENNRNTLSVHTAVDGQVDMWTRIPINVSRRFQQFQPSWILAKLRRYGVCGAWILLWASEWKLDAWFLGQVENRLLMSMLVYLQDLGEPPCARLTSHSCVLVCDRRESRGACGRTDCCWAGCAWCAAVEDYVIQLPEASSSASDPIDSPLPGPAINPA